MRAAGLPPLSGPAPRAKPPALKRVYLVSRNGRRLWRVLGCLARQGAALYRHARGGPTPPPYPAGIPVTASPHSFVFLPWNAIFDSRPRLAECKSVVSGV